MQGEGRIKNTKPTRMDMVHCSRRKDHPHHA